MAIVLNPARSSPARSPANAKPPRNRPDLTGYPLLKSDPDGLVRVARTRASVPGITYDVRDLVDAIDCLASAENITWEELFDVLRYARAKGTV